MLFFNFHGCNISWKSGLKNLFDGFYVLSSFYPCTVLKMFFGWLFLFIEPVSQISPPLLRRLTIGLGSWNSVCRFSKSPRYTFWWCQIFSPRAPLHAPCLPLMRKKHREVILFFSWNWRYLLNSIAAEIGGQIWTVGVNWLQDSVMLKFGQGCSERKKSQKWFIFMLIKIKSKVVELNQKSDF